MREQASGLADELMQDERVQRAVDTGKKSFNKAYETGSRMRDEFVSDYRADMSEDMALTSKFGFKMFVYAALLWGSFLTGSLQSMLLIVGWVLLVEKNMQFVKVAISACMLYIFIGFGCDIVKESCNLIMLIINKMTSIGVIDTIYDLFKQIKSLTSNIEVVLKLFIGFWGLIKARKGDYFRFKFIEDLF